MQQGIREEMRAVVEYNTSGLGGTVTITNGLIAIVIIVALLRNEHSAIIAIVTGSIYYAIVTLAALLILTGTLRDRHEVSQRETTQRFLIQHQYSVERPRWGMVGEREPDAAPLLGVSTGEALAHPSAPSLPPPTNFVAPIEEGVRREAMAWLLGLYAVDGQLDPKKVLLNTTKEHPGRIRVATPSRGATQYLLDRRILTRLTADDGTPTGYRISMRYLTREAVPVV